MAGKDTRGLIVGEADRLFYENGYGSTSFADIAAAVKISRGNFYYHFKTKDEILEAVIEKRLQDRAALLAKWEEMAGSPRERIACFIKIVITNQARIMAYGCPVGTLTAELAKLDHPARPRANSIMMLFRDWLARQFEAAGCGQDAQDHALHVLSWSQGIASLAQAFRDEVFVTREVEKILVWLDSVLSAPGPGQ